jgi:putative exporter of polyketide antibiotics
MSRRTRNSPRSRREFAAEPIGLLLVLVAALTFAGEIGFRRRDIISGA